MTASLSVHLSQQSTRFSTLFEKILFFFNVGFAVNRASYLDIMSKFPISKGVHRVTNGIEIVNRKL